MRSTKIALLLGLVAACGPMARETEPVPNPDNNQNEPDAPPIDDGCSDDAKLVYVVDSNNTLSSFDPVARTFSDLGRLACPAGLFATPFSMGIDRDARAWVLYSNGAIFSVDTETLACTTTTWSSPGGMLQFGMGFSTDAQGGTTDTLYIAGGPIAHGGTAALHRLDTTTMMSTPLGTVSGWPELTGTGSAELWGFFPTVDGSSAMPRIEQIDKSNGKALRTFDLPSLKGTAQAWAFAFYGGDFFVFLHRQGEPGTTVYQVDGQTGSIEASNAAAGRSIVGAGVSTCAPVILF